MKNTFAGLAFLSLIWLSACSGVASPENNTSAKDKGSVTTNNTAVISSSLETSGNEAVIQMTKAMFLEKVYNFEKSPKIWKFNGDKPCIVDFYADWCRPCKMVAPMLAELAEKYKGQITVYKVNTDQERELSQFFGINSIPTVFFCPANGDPQMTQGALPKETYEKIVTDVLLKK
ncbi:MAG: thioredoxin [Bacteroidota bacterium]